MYSINEYCGLLVKQAREEKNWTQQDLADEVDMDVRTIKKIEEGTTSSYYLTIEKLIYALNIAPNIMYHAGAITGHRAQAEAPRADGARRSNLYPGQRSVL